MDSHQQLLTVDQISGLIPSTYFQQLVADSMLARNRNSLLYHYGRSTRRGDGQDLQAAPSRKREYS